MFVTKHGKYQIIGNLHEGGNVISIIEELSLDNSLYILLAMIMQPPSKHREYGHRWQSLRLNGVTS